MADDATAGDYIVEDQNRINFQVGVSIVPDHHLARLPEAVMPNVVSDLSPWEASAIQVDPLPIFGRIVSDKNDVRNSLLFRAVNTQVRAVSVAKQPALTIFQRKLTAGIYRRCSLIRHAQHIGRIRDAAGLA